MSNIEISLFIILYIIIGVWICYKRDWYYGTTHSFDELIIQTSSVCVIYGIILMPLNLIVVFFREFILRRWIP